MASNDVEVLDPAVPVEKVKESKSGYELDRRHFIAALGVAGAAAGAALLSSKSAIAQQPTHNGFAENDVLNFMLNIKYLKATFYSYIIQGTDLPPSSFVTVGTGGVFNPPNQITFTGPNAQQITDVFNEMYYDELSQLIALRALLGVVAAPRPSINLLATGPITTGTASSNTLKKITYTPFQAIAIARMLEDLSASALANASLYLTGTNLNFAAQALATDGLHAGAIRLISIQNNVQYQGTQYASYVASNTSQTLITFTGAIAAGSPVIYALLATNSDPLLQTSLQPAVGNIITGIGIPPLGGAVVTSVNYIPTVTPTAIATKGSPILTVVSDTTGLLPGQPITGTNVPSGSVIAPNGVGANTITINVAATGTNTLKTLPTGLVSINSPIITLVSDTTGLIIGQPLSGTGIPTTPAAPTITAIDPIGNTITMSANATANSLFTLTGVLTKGLPKITSTSSVSGIILGQPIFGTGIPANTTVLSATANSVTMTANATASTDLTNAKNVPVTFHGIVTNGTTTITLVDSLAGLVVGQLIAGPGVAIGATITAISAATNTITVSIKSTATSTVVPTGNTTQGSTTITSVSSVAGLTVGQPITGTAIPPNTTITQINTGSNTLTLTISASPTDSNNGLVLTSPTPTTLFAGGQSITSNSTESITSPTTNTYTIGRSVITIAGNALLTGVNTYYVSLPDSLDVEPGDPGSAATSATGPSIVTYTQGGVSVPTSPAFYQGFFNTAGAATSSANTPPGFAFARTFQQVLAVLYNSTTTQLSSGGFFPNGVSGSINASF